MKIEITLTPVTSDTKAPSTLLNELADILSEMKHAELNRKEANLSGEFVDVKIRVTE